MDTVKIEDLTRNDEMAPEAMAEVHGGGTKAKPVTVTETPHETITFTYGGLAITYSLQNSD